MTTEDQNTLAASPLGSERSSHTTQEGVTDDHRGDEQVAPSGEVQTDPVDGSDVDTSTSEGDESDTFPREYVEKLRKESQGLRDRLREAEAGTQTMTEELEQVRRQLHKALVDADGRLVDSDALEYSEDHLSDPEALSAAVAELLAAKPYLSAKRFTGTVHQGAEPVAAPVSMTALLRGGRG